MGRTLPTEVRPLASIALSPFAISCVTRLGTILFASHFWRKSLLEAFVDAVGQRGNDIQDLLDHPFFWVCTLDPNWLIVWKPSVVLRSLTFLERLCNQASSDRLCHEGHNLRNRNSFLLQNESPSSTTTEHCGPKIRFPFSWLTHWMSSSKNLRTIRNWQQIRWSKRLCPVTCESCSKESTTTDYCRSWPSHMPE